MALVFRDDESNDEYSFDLAADPTGWTVAGSPHTVSLNETLSIPDGKYDVFLNIYDPAHADDPSYSVALDNENAWGGIDRLQ